jgi:photosystem II stability/assembly factor-like uncharacterized protein
MAQLSSKIAESAATRVFIIEGKARVDHEPNYESCLRMLGVSQGFGDIERVECPDPQNYGKFIEVGQIRGETERPTTSLEGRYMMDTLSTLVALARKGCEFDVQLHMGECTDPSVFNTFKKSIVLESAALTNFSTDDLGALASADNAAVNESADLSASDLYEIVPLTAASVAGSILTNEVVDIATIDSASCGECQDESNGCQKVFALTKAAGGSPSTPADLVFTIDGGSSWYAHDIDTLGAAEEPDGVDGVGSYVVVVSNATDSLHYALLSEFDTITDPSFTEVSTGFVGAGSPNAIWSAGNYAFIVGDGGYVYGTSDPTSGVDVLDAGNATTDQLLAVHGISKYFAVAVGINGRVIYTDNGTTWSAVTRPVGAGVTINDVAVKGENEWLVVTDDGNLYYTLDKGTTWYSKSFPGSGSGNARAIAFSNQSIGFLSHDTTTPRARIFRTFDGGYSWIAIPEDTGTMPAADAVNALAVCSEDPNVCFGGGLADDGSDGFIVACLA